MLKRDTKFLTYYNYIIIVLSFVICNIYTVIYLRDKDYLLIVSSILISIVPFFAHIINKRAKRKLSESIKAVAFTFYFFSAVLGTIGDYYAKVLFYDKFTHFTSGILISWLFIRVYQSLFKVRDNRLSIRLLFMNSFNISIAALWEVFEFTSDFIIGREFQKGLVDTMTDMIAAILGGLIMTVIYIYKSKRTTKQ